MTRGPGFLTIGHSNLLLGISIARLHAHGVATVADVRSVAASRLRPWFGFSSHLKSLADEGIGYVYLGGRLGGRPRSRSLCLPNGKPDYVLLAHTQTYRSGIDGLLALASRRRVALKCREGDSRRCLRRTLAGRTLRERGAMLAHILPDGSLVPDPPEQLTLFDQLF